MAKDKLPAQDDKNAAAATTEAVGAAVGEGETVAEEKQTKQTKRPAKKEPEYTVNELAAAAPAFRIGLAPECVVAAFRVAGKDRATKGEALQIINEFLAKEVK